jgi:threonine dehydratase
MKVTLQDIEKAQALIGKEVLRTPVQYSASASKIIGTEVYLKMENEQTTGSFKIRGAMNKMLSMSAEDRKKGVIASSAGNHAQGVAYSARKVGVEAHVVMPVLSSIMKQTATRNYGANVILHGELYDDAYKHARQLEKEKGYIFVPPYEDASIIAGQGTIALEVLEDIKDLDSIIVPIGGGGLISGIATAIKTIKPSCKVYGVVAENAPAMMCMYKNQPIPKNLSYSSIADGISVKNPSPVIYDNFISKYVDDIISIQEDDIAAAIVFLIERAKTVTEGSAAISLAAAFSKKLQLGKKTCVLLCGGNIDLNLIAQIIDRGLSQSGRVARLTLVVPDKPGQLNKITQIVAEQGANILEVEHDRIDQDLHIRETAIRLSLETKSLEHVEEIKAALIAGGFSFKR